MGISIDRPASVVGPFAKKNKMTFPILLDPDYEVASIYGVRGTPTSYLIDKKGDIIAGTIGPREWDSDAAKKLVETLLSEK